MPVRILLADKSITIQKVVEMLFSGRDYEVVSVSDGDAALNEAARLAPDVILVDVDLPRLDGYSFSAKLKQSPQLATIPVILMMSRDDVYDGVKGRHAGVLDYIAKPFESQEIIGKVKKALAASPPRFVEPSPVESKPEAAPQPMPVPIPTPEARHARQATPSSILDLISEAPSQSEITPVSATSDDESVYDVEPVVEEVEGAFVQDAEIALPLGDKAVEEIRVGLGLQDSKKEVQPEIVTFENLDMALSEGLLAEFQPKPADAALIAPQVSLPQSRPPELPKNPPPVARQELFAPQGKDAGFEQPPQQMLLSEAEMRRIAMDTIAAMAQQAFEKAPKPAPPTLTADEVWGLAEQTVTKMAKDVFSQMPSMQPPQVTEEKLLHMAEAIMTRMTADFLQKKVPQPPALPQAELRHLAEETVSRMALEVFKDMAPPIPKISEETVRRGIEDAVGAIVREIARDVVERVAWEVIPQMAEVLITAEIERLKAET